MCDALIYDTVDDHLLRHQPFREAHRAHAENARRAGFLVMAAAFRGGMRAPSTTRARPAGIIRGLKRAAWKSPTARGFALSPLRHRRYR